MLFGLDKEGWNYRNKNGKRYGRGKGTWSSSSKQYIERRKHEIKGAANYLYENVFLNKKSLTVDKKKAWVTDKKLRNSQIDYDGGNINIIIVNLHYLFQ